MGAPRKWAVRSIIVVLVLVLAVVLALVVWRRRARARVVPFAAGLGATAASEDDSKLPLIAPHLPPKLEMFALLRGERPEVRRHENGHRLVVYRREEDFARSDALPLHYTERIRNAHRARGEMPSVDKIWSLPAERQIALRPLREVSSTEDPLSCARAVRARLEQRTVATADTHPMLAKVVVDSYARKMRMRPHKVSVLDLGPGWGGQAAGACAANVGRYDAYILPSQAEHSRLAPALQQLLEDCRPSASSPADFAVSMKDFLQSPGGKQSRNVIFLGIRDLEPLAHPEYLKHVLIAERKNSYKRHALRGWVVLFLPPGTDGARAGQKALDLTRGWPKPESYCLEEKVPALGNVPPRVERHHALVWTKI